MVGSFITRTSITCAYFLFVPILQEFFLMGNVLAGLGLYGVRDFPLPFIATVAIELLSDGEG